jgi:hypothetical protein
MTSIKIARFSHSYVEATGGLMWRGLAQNHRTSSGALQQTTMVKQAADLAKVTEQRNELKTFFYKLKGELTLQWQRTGKLQVQEC